MPQKNSPPARSPSNHLCLHTLKTLAALTLVLTPPFHAFAQSTGEVFADCDDCPEMVIIPSGTGMLGAEPHEANTKRGDGALRAVEIDYRLAVGKTEVTRAQYRVFMDATGYEMARNGCNTWTQDRILGYVKSHVWDDPGYPQTELHPVVCVSYVDASAYTRWLSQKTGRPYRLLSSTEFEYATRAGTRGPWFWGINNADACEHANIADGTFRQRFTYAPVFNCDDGYEYTAPVATYKPNSWGLYDMLGNVWEWTEDCLHRDMADVPTDGSAWLEDDGGECDRRTPRGGSWVSGTDWVRAAAQSADRAIYHSQLLGFRVGLTIDPESGSERTDGSSPHHAESSDGVDIAYDIAGSEPTMLVFVHGWSCDRSYWREQTEAFRNDYTVVSIDLAGHGESGMSREDWTIRAFGADVAAVVEQESGTDVVLVGHSMGGPVILEAARQLGHRVRALVGVDTLKRPGEGLAHEQAKAAWSETAANFSDATEGFVRNGMFPPDADPSLVTQVATDMASAPEKIALAAGIGMTQYDSNDGLRATRDLPLILLNASSTPTNVEALRAITSNVSVKLFESTAHFPMLEAPDKFNAVLRETLEDVN